MKDLGNRSARVSELNAMENAIQEQKEERQEQDDTDCDNKKLGRIFKTAQRRWSHCASKLIHCSCITSVKQKSGKNSYLRTQISTMN